MIDLTIEEEELIDLTNLSSSSDDEEDDDGSVADLDCEDSDDSETEDAESYMKRLQASKVIHYAPCTLVYNMDHLTCSV